MIIERNEYFITLNHFAQFYRKIKQFTFYGLPVYFHVQFDLVECESYQTILSIFR